MTSTSFHIRGQPLDPDTSFLETGKGKLRTGSSEILQDKHPERTFAFYRGYINQMQKVFKDLPDECRFWLQTGESIENLYEFAQSFKTMDKKIFRHHVTKEKNDFANWVEAIYNDHHLAAKLRKCKNPKDAKAAIDNRIREISGSITDENPSSIFRVFFDKLRRKNDEIEKKLKEKKKEFMENQLELTNMEKRNMHIQKRLKQRYSTLKKDEEHLRQKIEMLIAKQDQMRLDIEKNEAIVDEDMTAIDELGKQMQKIKPSLPSTLRQKLFSKKIKLEEMEKKNVKYQEELKDRLEDIEEAQKGLERHEKDIILKEEKLQKQNETFSDHEKQLMHHEKMLKEKFQRIKSKEDFLVTGLKTNEEMLDEDISALVELKSEIKDMKVEGLSPKIKKRLFEKQAMLGKLQKLNIRFQDRLSKRFEILKIDSHDIESKQDEIFDQEKKVKTHQKDFQKFEQDIKKKEDELRSLASKLKSKEISLKKEMKKDAETLDANMHSLKELAKEIRELYEKGSSRKLKSLLKKKLSRLKKLENKNKISYDKIVSGYKEILKLQNTLSIDADSKKSKAPRHLPKISLKSKLNKLNKDGTFSDNQFENKKVESIVKDIRNQKEWINARLREMLTLDASIHTEPIKSATGKIGKDMGNLKAQRINRILKDINTSIRKQDYKSAESLLEKLKIYYDSLKGKSEEKKALYKRINSLKKTLAFAYSSCVLIA